MASLVPNTSANRPKITTRTFFQMRNLYGPKPMSQKVMTSMKAGAISPRIEKQKAPMTPISGPIDGTATASITQAVARSVRIV